MLEFALIFARKRERKGFCALFLTLSFDYDDSLCMCNAFAVLPQNKWKLLVHFGRCCKTITKYCEKNDNIEKKIWTPKTKCINNIMTRSLLFRIGYSALFMLHSAWTFRCDSTPFDRKKKMEEKTQPPSILILSFVELFLACYTNTRSLELYSSFMISPAICYGLL